MIEKQTSTSHISTAMIFAAGLGTRFKPWTDKHPKALAVINGKTLLQRNIEYLQQYGIKNLIINVHHFATQIIDALQQNNGWGSHYTISDETDKLLDTGGGLLKAKPFFKPGELFITCNADILTDLNIHNLIAFHQAKKPLISFATSNRKTTRVLLFDNNNRLKGWKNINTGEVKGPATHLPEKEKKELIAKAYSCIPIMDYSVFEKIEASGWSGKFSLIDVYLSLAEKNNIVGYEHSNDKWIDVGKPESVPIAESIFL